MPPLTAVCLRPVRLSTVFTQSNQIPLPWLETVAMAHGWHALVTTDQAARWPDGVGFLVRQLDLSESLVQTITLLSQYYHSVSWPDWTRDTACNNQGRC